MWYSRLLLRFLSLVCFFGSGRLLNGGYSVPFHFTPTNLLVKPIEWVWFLSNRKQRTTFNDGCLGSRNDEERSEMRYVMWIAKLSESSKFWTQIALLGLPWSMFLWESVLFQSNALRTGVTGRRRGESHVRCPFSVCLVVSIVFGLFSIRSSYLCERCCCKTYLNWMAR